MIGARLRRIAVIEAVDIAEQNHPARPRRLRDARGESVIVAEADFLGRDTVIFIDHRDDAQAEQSIECCRGVEVAAAMLKVVERHQHLRRCQAFGLQHFGPDLRQRDLSGRGGGLCILQRPASALGKPQPPCPERDRA